MRKLILEYYDAVSIDADYYGMVDVSAPLLLMKDEDDISDEELLLDFSSRLDLENLKELLEEAVDIYDHYSIDKLALLKDASSKLNNDIKDITDVIEKLNKINVDDSEVKLKLNSAVKERDAVYRKIDSVIEINKKVERKLGNIDVDGLYYYEFRYLTGCKNLKEYLVSEKDWNIKNLIFNKYQLDFVKYLIARGWELIDLRNSLNEGVREGVSLEALYKDIYELLECDK